MEVMKRHEIVLGLLCRIDVLLVIAFMSNLMLGIHCASKNAMLVNPNSILKTIEGEDGEVIDCVDIYKQPAFNHPLLVNHSLQMKPSSYPIGMEVNGSSEYLGKVVQRWRKKGEYCGKGTIPIARYEVGSAFNKTHPRAFTSTSIDAKNHEHAQVTMTGGNYFGGSGHFNVWNPLTLAQDFSIAQIWVLSGDGPDLNSIEAGWMVDGFKYHFDNRLFIYWTTDGYRSTGCYNLECPGFVQTSSKIALGVHFDPVSTYGGKQYEITINIHKDMASGNWWLQVQGEDIGYWPSKLFNGVGLSSNSTAINWGGEITNTNPQGLHTQTDMGSGHFASEGWGKAAFIRNMGYVDEAGHFKDAPHDLYPYATRADCYSVEIPEWNQMNGAHIYYGGPGYSPSCKT